MMYAVLSLGLALLGGIVRLAQVLRLSAPLLYGALVITVFRTRFLHSLSDNAAEKFPPSGGMGDWGFPQQARLSYKCYACVNAAAGVVSPFSDVLPCTVWIVRRSKSIQPQCPGKVGKQMILSSVSISGL